MNKTGNLYNFLLIALLVTTLFIPAGCSDRGLGAPCKPTRDPMAALSQLDLDVGSCDSTICISYRGSNGYCSQECQSDGQCEGGYICCKLFSTGEGSTCQDGQCPDTTMVCDSTNHCQNRQVCVMGSRKPGSTGNGFCNILIIEPDGGI